MRPVVALSRDLAGAYPTVPPFDPSERYPEFELPPFGGASITAEPNPVYPMLRECFRNLGFDRDRFGTRDWNPLATVVPRGGRVVLKPNFVMHEHDKTSGTQCLTTHASILRALLDYVILAGGPGCRIVIADAPLQQADFDAIVLDSGLDRVVQSVGDRTGVQLSIVDLRRLRAITDARRVIRSTLDLPGDPLGYAAVAVGAESRLEPISAGDTRFAVTDYDRAEMNRHHRPGHHEYLLSRTALACDAFINVPKLKTHQKVGVTLALKNLVGINGSKDWLPHYRPGPPEEGGDEFPERNAISSVHSRVRAALQGRSPQAMRAAQYLWHAYKRVFESRGVGLSSTDRAAGGRILGGAWHGNDTAWRMVLDLNQAILHASAEGRFEDGTTRRYLAVVDGIVGGEGDGPLSPEPKRAGILAVSDDPVALDWVLTHAMGFDPGRIPMLREAVRASLRSITATTPGVEPEVRMSPSNVDWKSLHLGFRPAPGWRGRIERPDSVESRVDLEPTTA
jgi:uncharacterized protein (DUF362 family)